MTENSYARAGVDTAAGDRAVELMKSAVKATHTPEVLGGVGGFAGLFDVSGIGTRIGVLGLSWFGFFGPWRYYVVLLFCCGCGYGLHGSLVRKEKVAAVTI